MDRVDEKRGEICISKGLKRLMGQNSIFNYLNAIISIVREYSSLLVK